MWVLAELVLPVKPRSAAAAWQSDEDSMTHRLASAQLPYCDPVNPK